MRLRSLDTEANITRFVCPLKLPATDVAPSAIRTRCMFSAENSITSRWSSSRFMAATWSDRRSWMGCSRDTEPVLRSYQVFRSPERASTAPALDDTTK